MNAARLLGGACCALGNLLIGACAAAGRPAAIPLTPSLTHPTNPMHAYSRCPTGVTLYNAAPAQTIIVLPSHRDPTPPRPAQSRMHAHTITTLLRTGAHPASTEGPSELPPLPFLMSSSGDLAVV